MDMIILTDKAKRLREWIKGNLKVLDEWMVLDDEIFHLEREAVERTGLAEMLDDLRRRRVEAEATVREYRAHLVAMMSAADLQTGYTPKTVVNLRRVIYLRYYRGFPIQGKGRVSTVTAKMGCSVSMVHELCKIALNRLADVWEETG